MSNAAVRTLVFGAGLFLAAIPSARADDPAAARFRGTGMADPIRITNLATARGAAGSATITFDVAWNHSWRAAWEIPEQAHGGKGTLKVENWDAAWLFAKFRARDAEVWSPATLAVAAADHAAPAGVTLDVGPTDDGKRAAGVFAYRAAAGSGPVEWQRISLRWLSEADGIADPAAVELKVFAINMVYVPECSFWLGDGSTNAVAAQFSAGDTAAPFRVESEAAITLGGESPKNLGNRDGVGMWLRTEDFSSGAPQTLPARFPKGHAAFYCMRHEVTEREFVDYLNTPASKPRKPMRPFVGKKGVALTGITAPKPATAGAPAAFVTERPDVACDLMLGDDCTGYATWAGLRPMSELEFEKACRGPLQPVAGEYAWGTAAIAGVAFDKHRRGGNGGYVIANRGRADERVTWQGDNGPDATRGNAVWNGGIFRDARGVVSDDTVAGPLRAGIFATPDSDRVAAGASYWGILELTGNLKEWVVSVGNIVGRRFDGTHGAWPAPFVTVGKGASLRYPEEWAFGAGFRGGQWTSNDGLRTSDRGDMDISPRLPQRNRRGGCSFRSVRTARVVPLEKPVDMAKTTLPENDPTFVRTPSSGWDGKWKTSIENVAVKPRDAKTATLTFDVSWSNSWRTEHNHDAAWVFFKTKAEDGSWRHVRLVADRVVNPTGSSPGKGDTQAELVVPDGSDGFTGLFIRRGAVGDGPFKAEGVSVVCDADSLHGIGPDAADRIRGFGIQMVYVPEGPFWLGSGGNEAGGFHSYKDGVNGTAPYRVTSAGPIPTGKQEGRLWARNHGGRLVDGGEIPATYPNGFAPFYCMKFHITPGDYADFLNTLDPKLAAERYAGTDRCVYNKTGYSGVNGHVFKNPKGGYAGSPGRQRAGAACFGMSWLDGATFAAWAGLRPITELELEKAVRGFREPAADEIGPSYWGISGFGTVDWDAFKGDPASERPVTAAASGLGFKGSHGLGTTALPADWPQADAVGSGLRHVHYSSPNIDRLRAEAEPPGFSRPISIDDVELPRARISDRMFADIADTERLWSHKWRGCRSAPRGASPRGATGGAVTP
ncbi:MAG: SUMF1/EgtB/PvdO family nonheme iron enzyme [Planctomycetia bacterium]